ncbi:MAG: PolC-type DNA polymerase III, partial [Phascolarctobacterium sp.]|nr:PolC-type DNA polymerase III [Candidatus Phascolarctobacterium caballi]
MRFYRTGKKYQDADYQAPLYFRTTEEMLAEFSYFGEEIAKELVATNPQKIAAMVERMEPVPGRDKLYSPHIDNAEKEIKQMAYARAHALYGKELPKIVADRLTLELNAIIGNGFAVLYYIAYKLVARSLAINYMVGSRGSVGSSFVATMVGITEVNPLVPHYCCPKCQHTEFFTNGEYASGFDLPQKKCPKCGTDMIRDGHNIPFAVFMGFHGDKVPDIDLNFSEVAQHYAHEYTKELFGRDYVCRAGTIATIAVRTAIGFAKKYFENRNIHAHPAMIASIVQRLQGVKRTTGQHPGGIMVVPRDTDIHYITPMNYPSNEKKMKLNILGEYDPPTITTHFDYHSINDRLIKLDILGHDDPGMLRHLEEIIPGLHAKDIPFGDPDTMAIFTGTKSLGVTEEQINCPVGTFGIPECGTQFVRQMIADVKPTKFSDVVRISGYSHGTDVWLNNAQDLIREGKPVKETISTRDDVMTHLIQAGVEPSMAFKTMEYVRKGNAAKKGLLPEMKDAMAKAKIPEWYMRSCETIQYLFPKAHAVAYVMMAYRIAYCKVHYPKEFYAAYFTERADLFDATMLVKGKDFIKKFISDTYNEGYKAEKVAKASLPYLELVVEMMERGFAFEPMDLYKSDAVSFVITEKGLRPPLVSLPGVGMEAAKMLGKAVIEAKEKNTPFLSREDLMARSGIGKSVVEKLAEVGALGDMPESNSISLFE